MAHSLPRDPADASRHKGEALSSYLLVYAALMVLLGLTVAASFVNFEQRYLGRLNLGWLNIGATLLIAVVKALLVVLFFMHVRHSSRLTRIFAAAAFLWLGILLVGTLNDYLTRDRPLFQELPDKSGIRQTAQPEANGALQVR